MQVSASPLDQKNNYGKECFLKIQFPWSGDVSFPLKETSKVVVFVGTYQETAACEGTNPMTPDESLFAVGCRDVQFQQRHNGFHVNFG